MNPTEQRRLDAVRALNLLDTPPEERFDRITRLAQRTFGVPIALISLIDEKRAFFKSRLGLEEIEMPLNGSFCEETLNSDGLLIVPDAAKDPRFSAHPLVAAGPRIRFYAGQPLAGPDGSVVGTLSLLDRVPRELDLEQRRALRDLAGMVQEQLAVSASAPDSELDRLVAKLRGSPDRQSVRRKVRAGFAAAALIVLAVTAFSMLMTHRLVADADKVEAAWAAREAGSVAAAPEPERASLAFTLARMRRSSRFFRTAVAFRAVVALVLLYLAFLLFNRDVDARLSIQAAVELERARFKAVIDGMGAGVMVADENGRFTLFNPAAERILGMGATEAAPREWTSVYGLFLPDGRTPFPADSLPLARAIAGETVRDVELVVRNPKRPGGVRISVTCTPIHAGDGSRAGAVAVFRDVSERA